MWAIEELRYYLAGCHFTLVTDHAALQWMAREKDTNGRVTQWNTEPGGSMEMPMASPDTTP